MSSMIVNGLHAEINTPEALTGEAVHGLPPHFRTQAYVVDEYPTCPETWEHGSDLASSYFVSLKAGRGMWFDFTPNQLHTHHVAVVISVQGINPVTGKPITELCLVQHKEKCPVHDIAFQQNRYCPTCKYKWPAQNYLATTTGETLWLDGFRNEGGQVRQYIVSEEQAKGIAAQIEARDPEFKRVWAIGFAFYLSREPKPAPPPRPLRPAMDSIAELSHLLEASGDDEAFIEKDSSGGVGKISAHREMLWRAAAENGQTMRCCSLASSSSSSSPSTTSAPSSPDQKGVVRSRKAPTLKRRITGTALAAASRIKPIVEQKRLEVGAGARIGQEVGVDPNPIDFWQEKPVGMIYVNFTDAQTLRQILEAGKRREASEGPLHDLNVGN